MPFQRRSYHEARHWSANNGDYNSNKYSRCNKQGNYNNNNNNKRVFITEYGNNQQYQLQQECRLREDNALLNKMHPNYFVNHGLSCNNNADIISTDNTVLFGKAESQNSESNNNKKYNFTKCNAKRSLNREIAVIILLFAAQTFSEINPSFTHNALSTEVIANTFSYPSADSAFRTGERCYAESEATMDYVYEKFSASIGSSEGVTTSLTRSEISDESRNDEDEENEDEDDNDNENDESKEGNEVNNNAKRTTAGLKKWNCNCNNENCAICMSNHLNDNHEDKNDLNNNNNNKKKVNKSKHCKKEEKENDGSTLLSARASFISSDYLFTNCNVAYDDKEISTENDVDKGANSHNTCISPISQQKFFTSYVYKEEQLSQQQLQEGKQQRLQWKERKYNQQYFAKSELWQNVLEFLPWREVLEVRRVSKFHFCQSLPFVAVCRLPYTKTPAFFISARDDFDYNEHAIEAALQPPQSSSIPQTRTFTTPKYKNQYTPTSKLVHNMPINENSAFIINNDQNTNNKSGVACNAYPGQRLFLGQLRRNGTVPMIQWLVNYVFNAPTGSLVCVENHRNAITSRGKGCAWPTIADVDTVNKMLSAHHRLYYDAINSVEGVWIMPHRYANNLIEEVQYRASMPNRPKHLPRGTMVMELPAPIHPQTRTNRLTTYNSNTDIVYHNLHNQVNADIFPCIPQPNESTSLWNNNLFSSNLHSERQFDQGAIERKSVKVSQKGIKSVKARKHWIHLNQISDDLDYEGSMDDKHERAIDIVDDKGTWRHNPYHPLIIV